MASRKLCAPVRGLKHQLNRLSLRQDTKSLCDLKCLALQCTRSISITASPRASVSSITATDDAYIPVIPFKDQEILATIHQFPSLEPLYLKPYPAKHLYLPIRRDILHRAVIYEGDMTRSGTASNKSRHEVHGSARKIRPQKGSGRARLGDKKSPMLRGGGVAFTKGPRDYSTELQKKVYDLAWRTALSYRYRRGELIIVDNAIEIESPSTRLLKDLLKYHEKMCGKGRNMLVTVEERLVLKQALYSLGREEQIRTWEEVDIKNLLGSSRIIIEREALNNMLYSHQEDMLHRAVKNTIIKHTSEPKLLVSIPGWEAFCKITSKKPGEVRNPRRKLKREDDWTQNERDKFRIDEYEEVAQKRFAQASMLEENEEQKNMLISACVLAIDSRKLRFQHLANISFDTYAEKSRDAQHPAGPESLPLCEVLSVQIKEKHDLSFHVGETSRLKGEEIQLEMRQLEVRRAEVYRDATKLAVEIYELQSQKQQYLIVENRITEGQDVLDGIHKNMIPRLGEMERRNLDNAELQVLEFKLKLAQQYFSVASLHRDEDAKQKLSRQIEKYSKLLEVRQAEMNSLQEAEELKLLESMDEPGTDDAIDVQHETIEEVKRHGGR